MRQTCVTFLSAIKMEMVRRVVCVCTCVVSRARVHDDDLQLAATTTADCGRQVNRGTIGDYYFSH